MNKVLGSEAAEEQRAREKQGETDIKKQREDRHSDGVVPHVSWQISKLNTKKGPLAPGT